MTTEQSATSTQPQVTSVADGRVSAARHWWTLPNQITILRFVLAIVVFVCLELSQYTCATVLFVIAASSDWIDGYVARRYGLITRLGRIIDPFVDKFIVCGVFIYLSAMPQSGIPPWLAVLVMARELIVTALRGEIEGRGGDFSAQWSGKWKMAIQCITATVGMATVAIGADNVPAFWSWVVIVAVALTAVATVHSGYVYVLAAIRVLRRSTV